MRLRAPANLYRGVRSYLERFPDQLHADVRAELMIEAYRRRRDTYHRAAVEANLAFRPEDVKRRTAAKLDARGIGVGARPIGEAVHTLAFVPMISWHAQLLPPLRALGALSHFDYEAHGLRYAALAQRDFASLDARRHACAEFEAFARVQARKKAVDWIFVYATGLEVLGPTLDRVREITGAPIVTMCLDDKQSWDGGLWGEQRAGQIDLAGIADLAWTSARVACEWYMVEGGNPVFMGEGCSPELFAGGRAEKTNDVCFVGQAYGFRRKFVQRLRSAGVSIRTAGRGWPGGAVSDQAMVDLMAESRVILGHGGVGWSHELKNVKGRDFDSPCNGAYLTTFNPDLGQFFDIGAEVCCFSSVDEAVEQLRTLLRDEDKRRELERRGRARCLADHTWFKRFTAILRELGIFSP